MPQQRVHSAIRNETLRMEMKLRLNRPSIGVILLAISITHTAGAEDCPFFKYRGPESEALHKATFRIEAKWKPQDTAGCNRKTSMLTGFVAASKPDGIITSLHGVLCTINGTDVTITATRDVANGFLHPQIFGLKVVSVDIERDLAFLSKEGFPSIPGLCESREIGRCIHTAGFPGGASELQEHVGIPREPPISNLIRTAPSSTI